jgi:hypothetical protein
LSTGREGDDEQGREGPRKSKKIKFLSKKRQLTESNIIKIG